MAPKAGEGGGGNEGFNVARNGDGRVALIGFPSVGKSSLLNAVTDTKSEVLPPCSHSSHLLPTGRSV
jgi:uncharacterized protein